ncbi:membrane-spanning 4-domains subfamily A member 4D-like [Ciona intestinalis]
MQTNVNPSPAVATESFVPYVTQQPSSSRNMYLKAFRGVGISELVMGCLSVLLGIVGLVLPFTRDYHLSGWLFVTAGIWGGIFIIVSGALGVQYAKTPTKGMMVGNLTMSVISTVISSCVVSFEIIAAIASIVHEYGGGYYYHHQEPVLTSIHGIIATFGFAAFILGIVHSAYCCKISCCNGNKNNYQQQVVSMTSGQVNLGMQYPGVIPNEYQVNQQIPIGFRTIQVPIYADTSNPIHQYQV